MYVMYPLDIGNDSVMSTKVQDILFMYHLFGQHTYYNIQISALVSQLEGLQSQLPSHLHKPLPPVPTVRPEEVPARKMEYTKESLLLFKAQIKAKEEAERQAAAHGADGGFFGGFGGEGGEGGEDDGGEEGEKNETDDSDVKKEEVKKDVKEGGDEREEEEESEGTSRPGSAVEKTEDIKLTPLQAIQQKEQQVHMHTMSSCCLVLHTSTCLCTYM